MHAIGRGAPSPGTRTRRVVVAALAALLLPPVLAQAATPPLAASSSVIEGHYIVVYKSAVSDARAETHRRGRALGFEPSHVYEHAVEGFAAQLSAGQVAALRQDDEVRFVAPDRRVTLTASVPYAAGEPLAPTGVRRILGATRTTVREASGTNVAVIDTGIALNHPDLNAVAGTNCIDPGESPEDDHGHGTHVAGTIGARNNGSGIVGVAPGTKIYAVKVFGTGATLASVICGVDWVRDNSAALNIKVANISAIGLADPVAPCATTTDPLHVAICNATAAGVLFVVAAGDSRDPFEELPSSPPYSYVPAAYPEVLTTTAISDSDGKPGGTGGAPACQPAERDDAYLSYSNFARTDESNAHAIAAPGTCITSTWLGNGYNTMSGTSAAAPHMAGVAALCIKEAAVAGACADMTPAQVIAHLRADAETYNRSVRSYGFIGDPLRMLPLWRRFGFLTRAPGGYAVDFDTDGLADRVVVRPSAHCEWWVLNSSDGTHRAVTYGVAGDIAVAGDYEGDRRIDIAVWRPSNSVWYVLLADGSTSSVQLGQAGDIPVPADYDGDGKTDRAVWRPSSGTWYVLRSSDGQITTRQWGHRDDKPVPGDFDGDRKSDIAVWRPSDGKWYVLLSASGNQPDYYQFGAAGDIPAPADYDGDGRTDRAVFRPSSGTWYVARSSDGGFTYRQWGSAGDRPVPAYYDGDRKADFAVWRPATGYWHVIKSTTDELDHQQFGHGNYDDEPVFRTGLPPLAS